jgi:BASS family bile acid:Na+ symporter
MLQRFLLVWLTILSLIAFWWAGSDFKELDPFKFTKPGLSYLFGATMFVIGCLMKRDEVNTVIQRWPTVLGGTGIQYIAMPLLAVGIGKAFALEGDLLLGVILVGCVPGAMASNVLTLAARGNVSYSVSLTTMATLLSPLIVPLTLFLAINESGIDRTKLAIDSFVMLLLMVVGPVLSGYFLSHRYLPLQRLMQRIGSTIANLTILWIIAVVVNANHSRLENVGPTLIGILLAINLLGYTAGFLGGKALGIPEGMRRALTLEVGMQNAGLGATLASALFEGRELVALPPALYTFGCMLTGTMLAQIWAKRGETQEESSTPEPTTQEA